MSAAYPSAVKTFASRSAGQTIASAIINDLQDEVNAIESGLLNGTAPLHSSNAAVNALSVSGNSTLGSTITIGGVPYIFPSSGGSTGQALIISSTSGSTVTLSWQTPIQGALTLLKANNGTDASAGATTVDSIAITGLTANDALRIVTNLETSSQNTAQVSVYHVTDAAALIAISASPLATTSPTVTGEAMLRQRNGNSTNITALFQGMTGATRFDAYANQGVTTAWTGAWTLGLRHGGVTAGGTFKWSWSVHKLAGQ